MKKRYPKICVLCGSKFIGTSPNAKYCYACKTYNKQTIVRMRNDKENAKNHVEQSAKYREGVVFVCKICGRKIRVHERTRRTMCNACLDGSVYGRALMRQRKDIIEEIVED